jgi:tetratricopeptide (TPR) repeat protein
MSIVKKLMELFKDREYETAMDLYNRHRYREAIAVFESVLKRKPSRASLHRNLANFYRCYAHRNLGIVLFVMGNYSEAQQEFQQALCCCTNPRELYQLMGICQNNIGDYAGAARTFEELLNHQPDSVPIKLRLGIALHNLKMWDKSVALYSTILAQRPRYADVHFRLGLALLGQGRPASAVEAFASAVAINPAYVEAHVKLGLTQAYLGRFEEALASFTAILEDHPDFADIHYALGIVYAGLDRMQEACAAFEKSLQVNPYYKDALIKLSMLHCHLGDHRAAAACLSEAGRIDPGDSALQVTIGAVDDILSGSGGEAAMGEELLRLFGGGKPVEQAIADFNRHLKIKPDMSTVLSIIKEFSHEDAGLLEMLLPVVSDVVCANPGYPDTHNTLGGMYLKLNRLERAGECFREALRLNPGYLKARVNLFTTLKAQGDSAGAAAEGARILEGNAEYPDIYFGMAEVLQNLGRSADALVHVDRAIELRPRYIEAHFLRADLLVHLERHTEAAQAYEACLALKPGSDIVQRSHEALQVLRQQH